MVEAELGLLEVQVEGMVGDPVELRQPPLGEAREALDAVDVAASPSELVAAVLDPQVLLIADVHQPVVPRPAIGMDDDLRLDSVPYCGQKTLLRAVGQLPEAAGSGTISV